MFSRGLWTHLWSCCVLSIVTADVCSCPMKSKFKDHKGSFLREPSVLNSLGEQTPFLYGLYSFLFILWKINNCLLPNTPFGPIIRDTFFYFIIMVKRWALESDWFVFLLNSLDLSFSFCKMKITIETALCARSSQMVPVKKLANC